MLMPVAEALERAAVGEMTVDATLVLLDFALRRDLLDAQISELRATLDYQKALVAFELVQQTSGGV